MELELYFPTTELKGNYPANASYLFKFLLVKSKFADWINNRINQYDFIENQDYIVKTTYTGRRPRKEYFITLNMAKELCMVENNEKGKQARRYFIECEKELQRLKFTKYTDKIANLQAVAISKQRHHNQQINGYKSQIIQHNEQIINLKIKLDEIDREKSIFELKFKDAVFYATKEILNENCKSISDKAYEILITNKEWK